MAIPPMHDLAQAALARRLPLRGPATNAFRLINGAADGLPGIVLEDYAGRWLLATPDRRTHPTLLAWLHAQNHPCHWKHLDPEHKESPVHLCGSEVTAPFLIQENHLSFEISFQSGYSQGIFLDQRNNRAEVIRRMRPGLRLLNTFAYTGAFSVAAASAGAETTTLDLSQPYLDWARRNFTHNGLDPAEHHFCRGNTFQWLRRFAKSGRTFDAVILDPPTFSRDETGRVFRVGRDFGELAALALTVLAPDGWLLCCTNCRSLSPDAFDRQLRAATPRPPRLHHAPMPADFAGDPYLKSAWLSC